MPAWIEEGLTILDKSMAKADSRVSFYMVIEFECKRKVLNLIEDPSGLSKHQNRKQFLFWCVCEDFKAVL